MRRSRLGLRRVPARSNVAKLRLAAAATAPLDWWDGTNVTLSGANVATVPNLARAGALATTGTTARAGTIGGVGQLPQVAAAGKLVSNRPASDYRYQHGSAGFTLLLVMKHTAYGCVMSTQNLNAASPPGWALDITDSSGNALFGVWTTNGTNVIMGGSGGVSDTGILTSAGGLIILKTATSQTPDVVITTTAGAGTFQANWSGAPDTTTDPETTFGLGGVTNALGSASFVFGECMAYNRLTSAAEDAILTAYLRAKFSV